MYFKSNFRVLLDSIQRSNICKIGTPEGKKGGIGENKIYDKIIAENLSKFSE